MVLTDTHTLHATATRAYPVHQSAEIVHVAGRWRRLARQVLGRRVGLGESVPWNERSHVSTATRNVCVNLNLFTRSEATVSAMDTTGVRHSVCSDSSTHHNTGTQIQHLPLIKHTSLSPRSPRRPPNQPHYVNYEIITDKPPRSPIGGLNTPPRSSHLRCLSRPS